MIYPKISVVIPTFGRPKYIRTAVESVFKQTYPNIELIVVDDNGYGTECQQETKEIMLEYKDAIYIPLEKNMGGANARNIGIASASGEWVAFLDDDDFFMPQYIEKMYETAVLSGYSVVYEAQWYVLNKSEAFCSKKKVPIVEGDIWNYVLQSAIPISILLLFNKKVFLENGGFDIGIKAYDDYDLWLSWSKNNYVACMNEPLAVVRREGTGHLTANYLAMQRGMDCIIEKWSPMFSNDEMKHFEKFLFAHKMRINKIKLFHEIDKPFLIKLRLYRKYIHEVPLSFRNKLLILIDFFTYGKLETIKKRLFKRRYRIIYYDQTGDCCNRV